MGEGIKWNLETNKDKIYIGTEETFEYLLE